MDKVRVHLILLLAVAFAAGRPSLEGFLSEPLVVRCLLHHFLHANIFHLAANCLAVWTMFTGKWSFHWRELLCGYIIGSAAFLAGSGAVLGFSNILFAVLGLRCVRFCWYKTRYFVVLVGATLLTALIPGVSGLTHILSLAGGFGAAWVALSFKKLSNDYGKARGNQ